MNKEIKIFPDIDSLNNFAAEKFVEIASEAIERNLSFIVSLAGGSTPKALYRLLAREPFKNRIDWTRTFFFIGDERNVPANDAESNFRMINENLFEPLKISDENIFRWRTELGDAEDIAADYEQKIKKMENPLANAGGSDKKLPRFDLILLGMGADGHTASLFPDTEALRETKRFAVANYVGKLQTTRLTMTFPAINNAANVMFLVSGAEKAEALREVLEGEYVPEKFPAQKVRLIDGNLLWLVDAQAARLLQ